MLKRNRLERRALAFLRGACRGVRRVLKQDWQNKGMLNATLEMYRKMVEQVWLATHDDLNILGTAQEYCLNPRLDRHGGNYCLAHFQKWAGDLFNTEFDAGII